MTSCPRCGALRFTRCATHGEWCVPCTQALSCPGCAPQRGTARLELLVNVTMPAAIVATMWLALVLFG